MEIYNERIIPNINAEEVLFIFRLQIKMEILKQQKAKYIKK